MVFTDTHCHFDFPAFDGDREALLAECWRRGVERIVVPGVTAAQWPRLSTLRHDRVQLYYGLGLHPWFSEQHEPEHLAQLEAALRAGKAVAVGETGLHGPAGKMEQQVELLEAQLDLARQFKLPVILHQVGAHNELIRSLKRCPPLCGGVVHAFAGSFEMAREYRAAGLRLGLGGVISYPRARRTRAAVARLPVSALVLETDGPDMPLSGFQGCRNSPVQIPSVFRALCQVRGARLPGERQALARALEQNADDLFPTARSPQ